MTGENVLYLLGVLFKISDEHLPPFYMRVVLPGNKHVTLRVEN